MADGTRGILAEHPERIESPEAVLESAMDECERIRATGRGPIVVVLTLEPGFLPRVDWSRIATADMLVMASTLDFIAREMLSEALVMSDPVGAV